MNTARTKLAEGKRQHAHSQRPPNHKPYTPRTTTLSLGVPLHEDLLRHPGLIPSWIQPRLQIVGCAP